MADGKGLPLARLLIEALREPGELFARLRARQPSLSDACLGLGLVGVISSLLLHLLIAIGDAEARAFLIAVFGTPFTTALVQIALLGAMALFIQGIARGFGGKGSLRDSVMVVALLQGLMILVQCAQIILLLALPFLQPLLAWLSLAMFFWLLVSFLAEAHGFQARHKVLFGVLASGAVIFFILSFLLAALLGPEVLEAMQNV